MPGKKSITSAQRRIGKTGNTDSPSYFITIPIEVVRAMQWAEGQYVVVRKSRGKVIIETAGNLEEDFSND